MEGRKGGREKGRGWEEMVGAKMLLSWEGIDIEVVGDAVA